MQPDAVPPPGGEHAGAIPAPGSKKYTLLGADRRPYLSGTPGQFGGHRKNKIYGRLDCPGALRAIAAGGYVASRVFFADELTASPPATGPARPACPPPTRHGKRLSRGRLNTMRTTGLKTAKQLGRPDLDDRPELDHQGDGAVAVGAGPVRPGRPWKQRHRHVHVSLNRCPPG